MNILFVYYVPSGGVETLNRQRSAALKSQGIQSHFLYYEKRRELVNNHAGPVFITNDDAEIKRIIDTGNYKAIVVVSDFQALPRFRKLGYTGKMIVEIQGYGPKHVARQAFMKAAPLVKQFANGLLYPKTPHIKQLFHEIFPTVAKFSFNNCFDAGQFTYIPTAKHPKPIIAWIGRIEDNKNWREFLLIGHRLVSEYQGNVELHMYEDPTISDALERKQFEALIQQLQLQSYLTIHTNVPNQTMAEHFSRIGDSGGFLCSTSKVEGAPYSLLEALSCKCPVLTTDSDGVRSSIIHNITGKYYAIGNIPDAVNQAKELMTHTDLRENIRNKGLFHVQNNFNHDLYGRHFLNMLISLGINPKK